MQRLSTWLLLLFVGWTMSSAQANGDEPKSGIALAMIALREPQLPSADEVVNYINKHWPNERSFGTAETVDDIIFFTGENGEIAFVSLTPFPIPWGDLEIPCQTAFQWPEACEQLKKMNSHAVVSVVRQDDNTVEAHKRNTMLVQAVSALSSSLGIYWGEAETVWSPEGFENSSLAMDSDPPYLLWVGLKMAREDDGKTSAYTVGMNRFGVMNVEVLYSNSELMDVLEVVGDVALYLLQSGAVIKDGETVGHNSDQKIKVSIVPSFNDPKEKAYRLAY
jgi:hypothetical protein